MGSVVEQLAEGEKDVSIQYLDPEQIIGKRKTKPPPNRSRSGYGSKLPSQWQLQLQDKRWRRVYVIQYSNAGSAYILVNGKKLFLGSYDPNYG
jgi:hypothetical protein